MEFYLSLWAMMTMRPTCVWAAFVGKTSGRPCGQNQSFVICGCACGPRRNLRAAAHFAQICEGHTLQAARRCQRSGRVGAATPRGQPTFGHFVWAADPRPPCVGSRPWQKAKRTAHLRRIFGYQARVAHLRSSNICQLLLQPNTHQHQHQGIMNTFT